MASEDRLNRLYGFFASDIVVVLVGLITGTILYIFKKGNPASYIVYLIFIVVLPVILSTLLLKKESNRSRRRRNSFIISILSCTAGLITLILIKGDGDFVFFIFAYLLSTIVLFLINALGYKVSGHAATVAGPTTVLGLTIGPKALYLFLLLIPFGISKIKLGEHTIAQFFLGAMSAVIATLIAFIIMKEVI